MTQELLEDNRIDLEPRMKVQGIIMQMIMERDNLSESDMLNWANEHGKDISDVIDNPENKNIRDLIFSSEYQKAAEETIRLLNK